MRVQREERTWKIEVALSSALYGTACQMSSAMCGRIGARTAAKACSVAAITVWHERRRGSSAAEM